MSGVLVLVVVGLWTVIGRWAWKSYLRPRVADGRRRWVGLAFAVAWLVLPVTDEILGAYQFRRLCAEIPPTRYYGPIAVGPGAFFDEEGKRRWKTSDEFARIRLATDEWEQLWNWRTEEVRIASWPMIVFQARVCASNETGRMVIETYFRGSGGGWINRGIGGGMLGSYQCLSKGVIRKMKKPLYLTQR
ncbi:MAG: hypothetical protein IPG28_18745 [Betaproteobacteria bacterium]|nr:hypothetical protein [Betaproteobacteria bacterium]